jgi:hypothetical protein
MGSLKKWDCFLGRVSDYHAMDPAGWVYEINHGGNLTRWAPNGGAWTLIDAQVTFLVMDSAGWMYEINHGGNLTRWAPNGGGWNLVGSSVQSFAFRSDGSVYVLHTNNDLTYVTTDGTVAGDFGVVKGFAVGPDGGAYILGQDGSLVHNTPSANFGLGSGIQSFDINGFGDVVELTTRTAGFLSKAPSKRQRW